MDCPACTNEPCTCLRPGRAALPAPDTVVRSTFIQRPDGITKEAFGLAFYDTIKTCGGIMALQEMINRAVFVEDHVKHAELKTRRGILVDQLRLQMGALPDEQAAQIAIRYEWVRHV